MTRQSCLLTTKDFTILEVMRDRCLGRDDPLARILTRKIESATVMFRQDIPVDVATLSSRVTFSVDGGDLDTRIICHDKMTSPIGMFLPITRPRGLALLGLREGGAFVIPDGVGGEERIVLHEVLYQPEAARREREALQRASAAPAGKPALRVIRGALHDRPRLAAAAHDGFDDPGPASA